MSDEDIDYIESLLRQRDELRTELSVAIGDIQIQAAKARWLKERFTTERAAIADAIDKTIAQMPDQLTGSAVGAFRILADRIRAGHYAPTGEGKSE